MAGLEGCSISTVGLNPTIDRILEVPGFSIGEHMVGQLRLRTAAGKSFNVARVLAALSVPCGAFGFVGQESLAFFESSARQAGVQPCFTPIAGTTRENITILDPRAHSETHIRDRGPAVTQQEIERLADDLRRPGLSSRIVVFSGSLATGLTCPRYAEFLQMCSDAGAKVVVDTSGEALTVAVQQRPWLIKPNLHELADLTGRQVQSEEDIIRAGRSLHERIALVIITQGARGALCFYEGRVWHGSVSLAPGRVRSTVGCGDAFLGGFLAEWLPAAGDVEAALRQAVAVAAASALDDLPAVFSQRDVDYLRPEVVIKSVRP